jgi:ABC-type transport system involved in multi-copper enzyme maturation permease subunit
MQSILSELLKLYKDRTIRVIFIFIILYIVSGPLFTAPNVKEFFKTAGTGELLSGFTTDTAFEMMLIGLVSAAVFAGEFSQGTIRNLLINNARGKVFFTKFFAVCIGSFALLFAWFFAGFVYVVISRGMLPIFTELKFYAYRFAVQYLLVLMQAGFLTVFGIITGRRALTNISTVFFWMILAFLPVNGKFALEYVEGHYAWGNVPSTALIASLLGIIVILWAVGYLLFCTKEIKH